MDRDTAITIAITTIVLTLLGGWFLGAPATPTHEQATFSTEDVRYKYQQAEMKHPKKKEAPPADTSPSPEPSANEAPENDESASDDSVGDETAEEPSIDD